MEVNFATFSFVLYVISGFASPITSNNKPYNLKADVGVLLDYGMWSKFVAKANNDTQKAEEYAEKYLNGVLDLVEKAWHHPSISSVANVTFVYTAKVFKKKEAGKIKRIVKQPCVNIAHYGPALTKEAFRTRPKSDHWVFITGYDLCKMAGRATAPPCSYSGNFQSGSVSEGTHFYQSANVPFGEDYDINRAAGIVSHELGHSLGDMGHDDVKISGRKPQICNGDFIMKSKSGSQWLRQKLASGKDIWSECSRYHLKKWLDHLWHNGFRNNCIFH